MQYIGHTAVGIVLLAGVVGCGAPAEESGASGGDPMTEDPVTEAPVDPTAIRPFEIAVSDTVLDDLQAFHNPPSRATAPVAPTSESSRMAQRSIGTPSWRGSTHAKRSGSFRRREEPGPCSSGRTCATSWDSRRTRRTRGSNPDTGL